ncbi:MAG: hypothetical protein ACKN9F_06705 [Methylomonas sp.]
MSSLSLAIKRLLDSEQPLKQSEFSIPVRKQLDEFALRTRQIEVMREGRSTVYRILNRAALQNYYQQLHPIDPSDLFEDLPNRSRNIGVNRNSKKGRSGHETYYLLMKAWDEDVVWQNGQHTLPVATLTHQFGAAVLQINTDQAWLCNRPLLLVENQALFDRPDWLEFDFDGCLIYYAGQISDWVLKWFAILPRSQQLVLFPDYDGIGLSNYLRLAETLPKSTALKFFWRSDWQRKLVEFGDAEIWANTRTQFENAFTKLDNLGLADECFRELAFLAQRHGKSLEQESIWL